MNQRQFQQFIFIFSVALLSVRSSFGQTDVGKTKVYSGKAKFLMTEINFKDFKAHKNCVGLIMFENISKKDLNITGVTKEFKSVIVTIKAQKIRPNQKGILTYTLINPSPGEFHSNSLIFFKEFNDPVKVVINANFL